MSRSIEEQWRKYQSELRKEEEALRKADQELVRQRPIISAEAYAQKRGELEQKAATLQREVRKRKRGLEQLFTNAMGQVRNELAKGAAESAHLSEISPIKGQIVTHHAGLGPDSCWDALRATSVSNRGDPLWNSD